MTYKATVTTTDLEVQFWDKSFKVKGTAGHFFAGDLGNNIERQKQAALLQEIYDSGRGKRREDKLPKAVALTDVKKVSRSTAKDGFHFEVGAAMEFILERLDETYGIDDMTPEQQHMYRVKIMAGIVSEAFETGRVRGLDEATDRIKATIWGTTD